MAIVANRTARRRAEGAAELASAFQHHQAGRFARAARSLIKHQTTPTRFICSDSLRFARAVANGQFS